MRIEKQFCRDWRKFFRQCRRNNLQGRKFDHLILKVGKLGRIEYIDKDVFTTLTYHGFYLEHKVNMHTNIFQSL